MTVRHSLLALLDREPAHGYGLKTAFEEQTSNAWPLNVGQVYTTLARLERDGFVAPRPEEEGPRQTWSITEAGRAHLADWYASVVVDDPPQRDELAIKVLLAIAAADEDVGQILAAQRAATMERLQEFTRHKVRADPDRDLAWLLILDAWIFAAEAQIRWLDSCAARLAARGGA